MQWEEFTKIDLCCHVYFSEQPAHWKKKGKKKKKKKSATKVVGENNICNEHSKCNLQEFVNKKLTAKILLSKEVTDRSAERAYCLWPRHELNIAQTQNSHDFDVSFKSKTIPINRDHRERLKYGKAVHFGEWGSQHWGPTLNHQRSWIGFPLSRNLKRQNDCGCLNISTALIRSYNTELNVSTISSHDISLHYTDLTYTTRVYQRHSNIMRTLCTW